MRLLIIIGILSLILLAGCKGQNWTYCENATIVNYQEAVSNTGEIYCCGDFEVKGHGFMRECHKKGEKYALR